MACLRRQGPELLSIVFSELRAEACQPRGAPCDVQGLTDRGSPRSAGQGAVQSSVWLRSLAWPCRIALAGQQAELRIPASTEGRTEQLSQTGHRTKTRSVRAGRMRRRDLQCFRGERGRGGELSGGQVRRRRPQVRAGGRRRGAGQERRGRGCPN